MWCWGEIWVLGKDSIQAFWRLSWFYLHIFRRLESLIMPLICWTWLGKRAFRIERMILGGCFYSFDFAELGCTVQAVWCWLMGRFVLEFLRDWFNFIELGCTAQAVMTAGETHFRDDMVMMWLVAMLKFWLLCRFSRGVYHQYMDVVEITIFCTVFVSIF